MTYHEFWTSGNHSILYTPIYIKAVSEALNSLLYGETVKGKIGGQGDSIFTKLFTALLEYTFHKLGWDRIGLRINDEEPFKICHFSGWTTGTDKRAKSRMQRYKIKDDP